MARSYAAEPQRRRFHARRLEVLSVRTEAVQKAETVGASGKTNAGIVGRYKMDSLDFTAEPQPKLPQSSILERFRAHHRPVSAPRHATSNFQTIIAAVVRSKQRMNGSFLFPPNLSFTYTSFILLVCSPLNDVASNLTMLG
jgi:hypothetical protein